MGNVKSRQAAKHHALAVHAIDTHNCLSKPFPPPSPIDTHDCLSKPFPPPSPVDVLLSPVDSSTKNLVTIGPFEVKLNIKELAVGGYGKVYNAFCSTDPDSDAFVAKQVPFKHPEDEEMFRNEVSVMRHLFNDGRGHSNIIRLHEQSLLRRAGRLEGWMVMEKMAGGELFDLLTESGRVSERRAKPLLCSVVSGLKYMHSLGVVHRDIKLENIMLCAEDMSVAKIIDFGLATHLTGRSQMLKGRVGTKPYRCPEMARKGASYHGPPVDVWAVGVTFFSLVAGFFPLEDAQEGDWRFSKLKKDQRNGVGACESIYGMYGGRRCPFSAGLQDLLNALFTIDVRRRPEIGAVATHPWLAARHTPGVFRDLNVADSSSSLDSEDESNEDDELCSAEPLDDSMPRVTRQRAVLTPEAEEDD